MCINIVESRITMRKPGMPNTNIVDKKEVLVSH